MEVFGVVLGKGGNLNSSEEYAFSRSDTALLCASGNYDTLHSAGLFILAVVLPVCT